MPQEEAQKYKIAETISIISHSLKNPIAVLRGYLESLLGGDCGAINLSQKEYLGDALFNLKEMSKAIDNLIDASRIETGEYKLNMQLVSLEEISFKVLSEFYQWAQAANCKIVFKKQKDLPSVLTDPVKVRKVIENLISNAIKYNVGQGTIEVSLLLKAGQKEIIFSCKDNGIGIDQSDHKKIFTKFFRSEKAIEIDPSGSGLGLYINKAIIELSRGRIWFVKNKKRGMTFSFALPIAKGPTVKRFILKKNSRNK
ncbi:MAG: hypothetical protein A3H01_00645 [Candidatus Wildermuthbacteria bacterium RIFCSPLOWO2_12_FULL_40_9]|uniref:histidine kinase n=2 Tax=Candidatus Wildermuthiibacteriota TaxID=1817923 RepID=A0A1G2RE82_9BACT|nr:MAG: hypothetical protein A3F15_02415 [Candidatus Wildermuthbacteria bacterium RIFCSPHIGHO2_12_FULL_40_12]OHA76112.1 MAG: hypothetical protein A3H01_00645 [Candidatus Wildermuthbacteria bacterium RIFCSPLOWO2_12_FULL_40_9]